ncbi:glycoside hydrolase family 2 TIM barrel-domain containing protein [Streptomyces massasporeus]|uniref:glycoside hydrolase family 2 TIM barrel-domain containing protein n=1 Tax=Streptomyces massasporeus TaxID=67324 RepID=UPI0033E23628
MHPSLRRALGACAALTAWAVGFGAPSALAVAALPGQVFALEPAAETVFSDDFSDGLARWARTTTPAGGPDWSVKDAAASVDTLQASSGSYLRPSGTLALPSAYELTSRVRIGDIRSDGTVSFVLDMQDRDNPTTRNVAAQITGVKPDGRAGVRVNAPLLGTSLCSGDSPVTTGDWLDVRIVRADGVTATYLGGRLAAATTSPAVGGTFAVGSYHSKVSIGAVTVRSLSGTPAGHPSTASGCNWKAPDQDAPGHQVTQGNPTQKLSGSWHFRTDPSNTGEQNGYQDPATDTTGWDTMPVPGNWDTRDEYTTYRGVGWYTRDFTVANPGSDGSRYRLKLDACYWTCKVWVNGTLVKSSALTDNSPAGQDGTDLTWSPSDKHTGGYTPFELDVTSAIRTSGTNTVAVKADSTYAHGAWWPWGGLSRDVSLTTTRSLSLTRQEITATPDLTAGTASVSTRVFVRNTGSTDRQITVKGGITSAATGADVPGGTGLTKTATIPAGQTAPVTLSADLARDTFSLWQLDDPDLYRFGVSVADNSAPGTAINGISDTFGIRSVKISGTDMLFNGKKLKMAGANRVSDNPVDGNTEPLETIRRDLDMMKSAGMSLTRIMHYAQSPAVLDYADRIGMLLIGEAPIWGTAADLTASMPLVKQQMAEQVQQDFNHPSIFAWSVGNELTSNNEAGRAYGKAMATYAKNIDPTRLVTMVNHLIASPNHVTSGDADATQFMDFAAINMYGWFNGAVEHTHKLYPNKPIIVTEYSTDMMTDGKHHPTSQESVNQRTDSAVARESFASKDYVFGWSQWTYNDYRSPYASSSPNKVRGYGDVDVWGRPKASYSHMQAANAPIRSLTLSKPQTKDGTDTATVTVTPRGALTSDGPSWTLKGYKLAVRVTDTSGAVVGGTIADLPEINPGGTAVQIPMSWKHNASSAGVRVSLLSPQGFQQKTTTVDLKTPAAPKITSTAVASESVRVRFSNAADGVKHKVTATAPDGTVINAKPETTSEPFADITGLTNGTAYKVTVSAVNSAGASDPDTTTLTPAGSLPGGPDPVKITPVDKGLVLGYTEQTPVDQIPATFEVAVTDTASGTQVRSYKTTARPGTRIEGLTPGKTYSLSVRRLAADGTSPATAWSEKVQGTVPGANDAPALSVKGTIGGITSGAIAVDPAPGTIRYEVTVGNGPAFNVNRSAVDLIPLNHLQPGSSRQVTIKAVGRNGTSPAWSGTLTTGVTPPTEVKITGSQGARSLTWTAASPAPDSYSVTRTACGTATTTKVAAHTTQLSLGADGGSYTVHAVIGSTASSRSPALGTGGKTDCGSIAGTTDTTARADGSYPFKTTGTWTPSALTTHDGFPTLYATATTSPAPRVAWTAPATGAASTYKVEVALPGGTSATSVTYTIDTATGKQTKTVNQNATGDGWVDLGTYDFSASQAPTVSITDASGGVLRASAARFTSAE